MLSIKEPRVIEPISIEEAKRYMRIDHDEDDQMIITSIHAASHWVENYLEKSLVHQKFSYIWEANNKNAKKDDYIPIFLPFAPVVEICDVRDLILNHNISKISYSISCDDPVVFVHKCHKKVEVTYIAGMYKDINQIPNDIKHAILLLAATLYERRNDYRFLENHPAKDILKCYITRKLN